jgi:trehalose 6-phosphate synthase
MRQRLAYAVTLLGLLGGLAWAASAALEELGRRWFEKDTDLRAQLAVNGRETLAAYFVSGDADRMRRALLALARDERILAAAACGPDGHELASTPEFPAVARCPTVRARLGADGSWRHWSETFALPSGRVHVSGNPVEGEAGVVGFIVLVHDMSWADRRKAAAQWVVIATLLLLALAASGLTVLTTQVAWRRWTSEVRQLLRGSTPRREFDPLLVDIRDMVTRLTQEAQGEGLGRFWGPDRLRQALRQHLHGERIVIVANREPYIHHRDGDGSVRVLHPASGLVTALEPVMRACSGVWVAHGSGSADRETSDAQGRLSVPKGVEDRYRLRRVWLTPEEEQGYYYGFANEGLWPLCHVAHTRPVFRAEDHAQYRRANEHFARAVLEEVDREDPIVLVQDYHFALLPAMLRASLPRATIITFWHIPWPNFERFGICPWPTELLQGLLGSSILGFHTQYHCNHFLDAVDRYLEARIDREQQGVVQGGRMTLVRPYPISIEWPSRWLQASPTVAECRSEVAAELGLSPDTLIGVGVDRLDYTKGIEERLLAVERLLERFPQYLGRFTFVQLAAPSRTKIDAYSGLNERVEALARRIDARFGRPGYRPVVLARQHHEPPTVFKYYRAADVCYVSSLHDGMNLVAKEFVAARDDGRGVLVLSQFTGAARELPTALLVNPYDLDQASDALASALAMSPAEQQARMEAMRLVLAEHNVYRWAGRMLMDAARLRRQDRLIDRLASEPVARA